MAFLVPKRDRPKATEQTRSFLLPGSTFNLSNQQKDSLGVKGLSNSQFADIFLQNRRPSREMQCTRTQGCRGNHFK